VHGTNGGRLLTDLGLSFSDRSDLGLVQPRASQTSTVAARLNDNKLGEALHLRDAGEVQFLQLSVTR